MATSSTQVMSNHSSEAPTDEASSSILRQRADTALSDILMSDTLDDDTPDTDPSDYSPSASASIIDEKEAHTRLAGLNVDDTDTSVLSESDKAVAESPLFKLPRELRDRVYLYCLLTEPAVLWPSDKCSHGLAISLLRTCSAVLHEAAPLLYSDNMLHFQHPSDANMFLWAHNPILGRMVTRILMVVRDKDVRSLWSPYLGSTSMSRSLLNDYPRLNILHVQLKSNFLYMSGGPLEQRFKRWENDKHLNDLCAALESRVPEKCEIKVLVCSKVSNRDGNHLCKAFSDELFSVHGLASNGDREGEITVRTNWRPNRSAFVALQLEASGLERIAGP